jgi:hypothetical protein
MKNVIIIFVALIRVAIAAEETKNKIANTGMERILMEDYNSIYQGIFMISSVRLDLSAEDKKLVETRLYKLLKDARQAPADGRRAKDVVFSRINVAAARVLGTYSGYKKASRISSQKEVAEFKKWYDEGNKKVKDKTQ